MIIKTGFKEIRIKSMSNWDSIFSKTSVEDGSIKYLIGLVFRIISKITKKEVMITSVGVKR